MRRSTPSAVSSNVTEPLRALTNEELVAVATLWKRSGRELVTRFTGSSMEPTIAGGADVTLLCSDDVTFGDVVAYVYVDRVIVHRIVASWSSRLVTRGDANLLPDPVLIEPQELIGKVADASPSPRSLSKTMVLLFMNGIARIFGSRNALRLIGILRAVYRRLRPATTAPEPR